MKKKLTAEYFHRETKDFDLIELHFSVFGILGGNPRWFCRIWKINWVKQYGKSFGESYGKNKFEAYRKALIDLNK